MGSAIQLSQQKETVAIALLCLEWSSHLQLLQSWLMSRLSPARTDRQTVGIAKPWSLNLNAARSFAQHDTHRVIHESSYLHRQCPSLQPKHHLVPCTNMKLIVVHTPPCLDSGCLYTLNTIWSFAQIRYLQSHTDSFLFRQTAAVSTP